MCLLTALLTSITSHIKCEIAENYTLWATVYDKNFELTYLNPAPDFKDSVDPNKPCSYPDTWRLTENNELTETIGRRVAHLTINRMSVNQFPPNIFYQLCTLLDLKITGQHIKEINATHFEHARQLLHLDLSHNDIERLEPYTFSNTRMVDVNLSFNRIEFIDENAFNASHMGSLYLNNNRLTEIQWEKFNAMNLGWLYLNNNYIASIKSEIPLKVSWELNIANNPLGNSAQPLLVMTRMINMRNCGLTKFHIFPATHTFWVDDNPISHIEFEEAYKTSRLKVLSISNTSLTSASILMKFDDLDEIDLSHNLLEGYEEVLTSMRYLKKISLSHIGLKNVDFVNSLSTKLLKYLDVSYNYMVDFRLNGLFSYLEELHIEGNNLTEVDTNIKQMAPVLTKIGLDDNNLTCSYLYRILGLYSVDGLYAVRNDTIRGDGIERKYTGSAGIGTKVPCYA